MRKETLRAENRRLRDELADQSGLLETFKARAAARAELDSAVKALKLCDYSGAPITDALQAIMLMGEQRAKFAERIAEMQKTQEELLPRLSKAGRDVKAGRARIAELERLLKWAILTERDANASRALWIGMAGNLNRELATLKFGGGTEQDE